jgi:Zn-finger nucleic acid-binding protein
MRRLVCPTCAGSQLQTRMQGAVEISRCRDCGGIWLAKTEVAKILSARNARPVTTSQSSVATKGTVTGIGADMADGLGEATPLAALEAGGEIGSAVGDFLVSFLG